MSAPRVVWTVAGEPVAAAAERASRIAVRLLPLSPDRGALWSEHADRVLEQTIVASELGPSATPGPLLAPDGSLWEPIITPEND